MNNTIESSINSFSKPPTKKKEFMKEKKKQKSCKNSFVYKNKTYYKMTMKTEGLHFK